VADLGLVRVAALVGIFLVANDGITTEFRFLELARRLTWLGGLYGLLGLLQFFSGTSFVDAWQIPGLTASPDAGIGARYGFVRAVATASHPLEYSVVLTMLLPFCLALAIYDRSSSWLLRWAPVGLITVSSALSVTRSALLAMVAIFVVLLPSWPKQVRITLGAMLAIGSVAIYVAIPGMAGTILGMFSSSDASITSRTDSYDTAADFLMISPFLGRGFGTFMPAYRILDNQYLLSAIEIGLIGLTALVFVIVAAMVVPLSLRRRWSRQPMKAMGIALFASMLAGGLILAFFDAFAFPQACGTLFMVAGICGAYANITTLDPFVVIEETTWSH
jgi:O-antigen ligase